MAIQCSTFLWPHHGNYETGIQKQSHRRGGRTHGDNLDQQVNALKEPFWYAAFTRSRHEKVAASMLSSLGICHFLPLITEVRRWSDRRRKLSVPLFPGYVFVKLANSSNELLRVLKVPGVISFVGNTRGPMVIPEEEIEYIRTILANGLGLSPHPFLATGDRVRIIHGPLAGVEGVYVRSGPDSRFVITIEMIQRSVAIKVDSCDIETVRCRPSTYARSEELLTASADRTQMSL